VSYSGLIGHLGGLDGSFLAPQVRDRPVAEVSDKLGAESTSYSDFTDMGAMFGAHLLFHAVKEPAVNRDEWYKLYRKFYDHVDDYDNANHTRSFWDQHKGMQLLTGADALTKEKPIVAAINKVQRLYYAQVEHLTWVHTILDMLRLDKLAMSARVGANLKWNRLNTDVRRLRGMPLFKGVAAMVAKRMRVLDFDGPHGEKAISIPFLITPGSGHFEISSGKETELGEALWQFPLLSEMGVNGAWALSGQTVFEELLGASATEFMSCNTGSAINPGVLVRLAYRNFIRSRDNLIAEFGADFLADESVWVRFFGDEMDLFESVTYDWTTLSRDIQSTSPVKGSAYAEANMVFAKTISPMRGFNVSGTNRADNSKDPRALPDITSDPAAGFHQYSPKDLVPAVLTAAADDRDAAALLFGDLYPYVGFYFKSSNFRELLDKMFDATPTGNMRDWLNSQVEFINLRDNVGYFGVDAVAIAADEYPFDHTTYGAAYDDWHWTGQPLIISNLLAMFGQLIVYAKSSGSMVEAVQKWNEESGGILLNPWMVEQGFIVPYFKIAPAHDPYDPLSCGFFRCISSDNLQTNLFSAWYRDHVKIPLGENPYTLAAHVAFESGKTNADNVWEALHSTLMDGLYFIGAGVFETPNSYIQMDGLTKASFLNCKEQSGAITQWQEALRILDHAAWDMPAALVGYDPLRQKQQIARYQGHDREAAALPGGLASAVQIPQSTVTLATTPAVALTVTGEWTTVRSIREESAENSGIYAFSRGERGAYLFNNFINWAIGNFVRLVVHPFTPEDLVDAAPVTGVEPSEITDALRLIFSTMAFEKSMLGNRRGGQQRSLPDNSSFARKETEPRSRPELDGFDKPKRKRRRRRRKPKSFVASVEETSTESDPKDEKKKEEEGSNAEFPTPETKSR
jgi:hypothetical protein